MGYVGIMEKNMETTIVFRGYIGMVVFPYSRLRTSKLELGAFSLP